MSELRDTMNEAIGKKWTGIFAIAFTVLFVYSGFALIAGIWPFSSAVGVARQVTTPQAIIQNYEWFYDQHNAIEAQRLNVEMLPKGSAEYVGTAMVLNNMIAEYNSRSKQITRNLWKADNLPYQIGAVQ